MTALKVTDRFETTLSSAIDADDVSIALESVSGLSSAGGTIIVDWKDANNVKTPTLVEEILYTGITDTTLTGCTRGVGGTAQSHASGAKVTQLSTAYQWNQLIDTVEAEHSDAGAHDFPDLLSDFDGWQEANETWAYASATTITVPSGAASKYQKGDKVKLTQTTDKYFYITGVADTVLTVTGGSDYTVADAAITSPYYSKMENPQGFPHRFNFTPVLAVASGTAPDYTTFINKFNIVGNLCIVQSIWKNSSGGTAGSGGNPLYFGTFPATPDATMMGSSSNGVFGSGFVYEAAGTTGIVVLTNHGTTTFRFLLNTLAVITGDNQSSADRSIQFTLTFGF